MRDNLAYLKICIKFVSGFVYLEKAERDNDEIVQIDLW